MPCLLRFSKILTCLPSVLDEPPPASLYNLRPVDKAKVVASVLQLSHYVKLGRLFDLDHAFLATHIDLHEHVVRVVFDDVFQGRRGWRLLR